MSLDYKKHLVAKLHFNRFDCNVEMHEEFCVSSSFADDPEP